MIENQKMLESIKMLQDTIRQRDEHIKRLEEAGDALLELCEANESQFHLADQIDARCQEWRKAKEEKL